MSKIKYILSTIAFIAIGHIAIAQNTSPYSRYGLGNLTQEGSVRSRTMGGTGIGMQDRTDVNNINPSALVAMDSTAVLFDLGFHANVSKFSQDGESDMSYSGNVDYITLLIPMKTYWFTSLNLQPVSSVGYDINTINSFSGADNAYYYVNYDGSGGGSQASIVNSVKLPWGIAIGAELGFLWGNHDETITENYPNMDMSQTVRRTVSYYNGMTFCAGIQYAHTFKNNTKLILGGIYKLGTKMTSDTETTVTSSAGFSDKDTEATVKSNLPKEYGAGFSLKFDNKMTVAADYKFSGWDDSEFGVDPSKYVDNHVFNGGFEYVPNYNSNKYRERVSYRFGLQYETGYFKISNKNVQSSAVTFGLGLPGRMRSTIINVGVEIGSIGGFSSVHITETYGQLNIGLNLGEIWFTKQKFY